MRILVVCGAGASSTFVARRLRHAAAAAGLDWDASAGVEGSVPSAGHDLADLVLVGPHLADRLDALRARTRVPVAVLPADVFSDHDGERTLSFVRDILATAGDTSKGTS